MQCYHIISYPLLTIMTKSTSRVRSNEKHEKQRITASFQNNMIMIMLFWWCWTIHFMLLFSFVYYVVYTTVRSVGTVPPNYFDWRKAFLDFTFDAWILIESNYMYVLNNRYTSTCLSSRERERERPKLKRRLRKRGLSCVGWIPETFLNRLTRLILANRIDCIDFESIEIHDWFWETHTHTIPRERSWMPSILYSLQYSLLKGPHRGGFQVLERSVLGGIHGGVAKGRL